MPTVPAAVETFTRGFTFTRSFTHPYVVERVGGQWVMRDAPRRTGRYRTEEWVALTEEPTAVDAVVREHARSRFALCVVRGIDEPAGPLREAYKALGYRLRTTEPLMMHRLRRIPKITSPATIQRVTTPAMADRLTKAAGARQVRPEDLQPGSRLRQYVATIDGDIVGWVRSIACGDATWCSNMFVRPAHRRRGIGKALLARMLRDDRAGGATQAVLLASHTGAKLYPTVGYEQIGELLLYAPRKNLPILTARARGARG